MSVSTKELSPCSAEANQGEVLRLFGIVVGKEFNAEMADHLSAIHIPVVRIGSSLY
jgi:hypothetical protein